MKGGRGDIVPLCREKNSPAKPVEGFVQHELAS